MLDYRLLRYARNDGRVGRNDGGSGYFVIARDSLESRGNLSINAVTNGCNGIFKSQDKIIDCFATLAMTEGVEGAMTEGVGGAMYVLDYGFALKRVKMLRICALRLCLAMTKWERQCLMMIKWAMQNL